MVKKICFATSNKNKFKEIASLINEKFQLLSLEDMNFKGEIPETTGTIEGNAIQKAEYIYNIYKIPCFSDDSGLEITALNGGPGVDSAMYAGEHRSNEDNINLVLKKLKDKVDRSAQFKTVIAFKDENVLKTFTGITKGTITDTPRGKYKFGYDPIFMPQLELEGDIDQEFINKNKGKTYAELGLEDKNRLSHRVKAVKKLINFLVNGE